MDFLPSSITSAGRSENLVYRTNSTTYFVSPGVCGKGAATQGGFSPAPSAAGDKPTVVTTAPKLAEDRKKSRLFMAAKNSLSIGSERVIVDPASPLPGGVSYFFPTAITTNEFGNGIGRPRGFSGLGFGAGPRSAVTVSICPVEASNVMVRAPFLVGTFSISAYFPSR